MFDTYEDRKKKQQQYGYGGITPVPYFSQSPFVQAVTGGGVPLLEPSLDDWRMTEEDFDLYRQALKEFVAEEGPSGMPGPYGVPNGTAHPYAPNGRQWGMPRAGAADSQWTLQGNPPMGIRAPESSVFGCDAYAADAAVPYDNSNLLGESGQDEVIGIQSVGENPTVRLMDGRVVPISQVSFGDYETRAMYEVAAEFPDSANANRFLRIFRDSGWEAPEFLQLYRDELRKDVQSRTAAQKDVPDPLSDEPLNQPETEDMALLSNNAATAREAEWKRKREDYRRRILKATTREELEAVRRELALETGWDTGSLFGQIKARHAELIALAKTEGGTGSASPGSGSQEMPTGESGVFPEGMKTFPPNEPGTGGWELLSNTSPAAKVIPEDVFADTLWATTGKEEYDALITEEAALRAEWEEIYDRQAENDGIFADGDGIRLGEIEARLWDIDRRKSEIVSAYGDELKKREEAILAENRKNGIIKPPEDPSMSDLLNAVLTPKQREHRENILNFFLEVLSEEQKRRIEEGEDVSTIFGELGPELQVKFGTLIDGAYKTTMQQQMDFAFLRSGVLAGFTLGERLALLQLVNEKNGQITPGDLKKVAAAYSEEDHTGIILELLNQAPPDSAAFYDFISLLGLPYNTSRFGMSDVDVNAEYMAQQHSEASKLITLKLALAVGAWVEQKMFLSPGKIPGGLTAGAENSWYNTDGTINMPPNSGAAAGSEEIIDLQLGQRLGRYGGFTKNSDFVAEPGSSADSLSLPPYTDTSIYQEFEILKPIPGVTKSIVAPWGDSPGLGLQYKLPMTIQELIDQQYIRVLP